MAAEQRLSPFLPRSSRGGQSAERRWCGTPHPWPASRSGRSPDRQGSPANDAGRRASRRSTAAFREIEISLSAPGRAFGGPPLSPFDLRASPVLHGGRARAARRPRRPPPSEHLAERSYCRPARCPEPPECRLTRPARRGRPSLHPPNVSGRRPSASKVPAYILIFLIKSIYP